MKKVIAIAVAILLVFSMSVFAKAKTKEQKEFAKAVKGEGVDWAEAEHIITANPIGLIFGYINAHYEMAVGKGNGLGFNGGLNFYGAAGWSWFGFSAGAEYNWYFQQHALNGWFAGPMAGISMISINYEYDAYDASLNLVTKKESASAFGFQLGGKGGYRWIWDGGFTLDVQGGIIYTISGAVTLGGSTAPFGGVGPALGVNLGYAW